MKRMFCAAVAAMLLSGCATMTQAQCEDALAKARSARAKADDAQRVADAACSALPAGKVSRLCDQERHAAGLAKLALDVADAAVGGFCASLPGLPKAPDDPPTI